VDVPAPAAGGPPKIEYDEEWLAILRETHSLLRLDRRQVAFPTALEEAPPVADAHREHVRAALAAAGGSRIPSNFVQMVNTGQRGQGSMPQSIPKNPQTEAVLEILGRPWNLHKETVQHFQRDYLFDAIEINNFDPHGISDAREADGSGPAPNPEEIELSEGSE
jgi:Lariat debranching enzyme, C-terminal domain